MFKLLLKDMFDASGIVLAKPPALPLNIFRKYIGIP